MGRTATKEGRGRLVEGVETRGNRDREGNAGGGRGKKRDRGIRQPGGGHGDGKGGSVGGEG